MAKKKNAKEKDIENLCNDEDAEISFVDNPVIKGKKVACFDFDSPGDAEEDISFVKEENAAAPLSPKTEKALKRSYMLSPSTIRKIDELKAKHPNLSTYVSTIVEDSINFYYDYVMNLEK